MNCIGSIIIFYKIEIHVGLYFVDLELIIIDYFNFVKDLDRYYVNVKNQVTNEFIKIMNSLAGLRSSWLAIQFGYLFFHANNIMLMYYGTMHYYFFLYTYKIYSVFEE